MKELLPICRGWVDGVPEHQHPTSSRKKIARVIGKNKPAKESGFTDGICKSCERLFMGIDKKK